LWPLFFYQDFTMPDQPDDRAPTPSVADWGDLDIPPADLPDLSSLSHPSIQHHRRAHSHVLMQHLARRAAQKALADIGLDDPAARDDLADLRAALASGRRLRFGLLQQLLGWCVQGLMLLVALGVIMLASGAD